MESLQQLTRFDDRLTFLYLEKGHIEQNHNSVAYVNDNQFIPIPAADLALLLLGPGTTITHRAICNLADCNCTVVWCGDEGSRFYCHGRGATHFSANLLRQIALACDPVSRGEVVRRMYERRFQDKIAPGTAIEVVRGKEGYRVRAAYQRAALEYGVEWKGRNYDANDWGGGDPLNRALSAGSAVLNGIIQAGIVSAGYSAAVGFVHTGKMLSFVYDVADLYKVDLLVPLVFKVVSTSTNDVERRVRLACRVMFHEKKLLERILPDIQEVLNGGHDSGSGPTEPKGGSESLDAGTEGRNIPWSHDHPHSGGTLEEGDDRL